MTKIYIGAIILITLIGASLVGVLIGAYINDPDDTVRVSVAFTLAFVFSLIAGAAARRRT